MTPTLPHPSTPPTARRARIFLHVRPHRAALLCSLALLTLAGTATAQLPALPAIDQAVPTPLGTTTAQMRGGALEACSNAAASTAALPSVPVPVAVPLPVAVPTANAAADLCARVDTAPVTGLAMGLAAGQVGLDGDIASIEGKAGASAGPVDAFVEWFLGLF